MTKISNQYSLTNILTADLANSRLGINNVSPTVALDVTGAGKFSSSLLATSYNATTQNIFAVDGTERMRITSAGLVGIGTTTVSSLLTLSQSAFNKTTLGDARVIRLENSDPTVQLNSRQEIGFGYSTAYQPVVIGHQITNNTDFTNGSFYIAVRSGVGNTAPVQALTVIPGGNVGIGTTSPTGLLQLNGSIANSADSATFTIKQSGTSYNNGIYIERSGERNGYYIYIGGGADALTFRRNYFGTQSDVMSLTRDGNVGIGTTSPTYNLQINSSSTSSSIHLTNTTTGALTSDGGIIVQSGLDMTFTNREAGRISFETSNTERMRIASAFPTLLIGMSNNVYGEAGRGTVEISGTTTSLLGFNASGVSKGYLYMNGTDIIGQLSTGGAWQFKSNNGGVQLTFNSTAWASISDERLKNINSYINNAVDKLNTLRTINYSWKSDNTKQEFLGLIAQDVDKVFPEVIEKNKKPENIGEVKDETEYLSVKYTELVPVLVKAIQELSAKVSLLENK